MISLVIGGLGVLVALATIIGVLLDRDARSAAWTRIATARRIDAERLRDLEEREGDLGVRNEQLALRERRLDLRERVLVERETRLEQLERQYRQRPEAPPDLSA